MALTDQPYLPLYVDDWMNNNKLKMCSAGAHGLMVSIMCLMHKSETYGVISLKQKFKQSDKQKLNFACQIAKLSSFDLLETEKYFNELIDENVLKIEGDNLICLRMVKDADVSKKRALSGKNGGKSTQKTIRNFALANIEANTGIEYVSENVNEIDIVSIKKGKISKFEIPKISEIQEYCNERKNNVDPIKFFDFYSGKGWMIGKNKMQDWKACIRTWEKPNDNNQYGKQNNQSARANSNQGYQPAKVDRDKLIQELADDAANGNIPGNYSQDRYRS